MSGTVNVIPSDITATLNSAIDVAPVTVNTALNGTILNDIKATTTLNGDLLENIKATTTLASDLLDKIKADGTLKSDLFDKIKADGSLTASIKELAPLLLTLLWTEIPMVRIAAPHHYKLSFSILGFEVFSFGLSGESKVVTAKNPNGNAGDIHV